jgi:hypothetical protein
MATNSRLAELLDMNGAISLAAMKTLAPEERGELQRRWTNSRPQRAVVPEEASPKVPISQPQPVATAKPTDPAREAEGNRLAALMIRWKEEAGLRKHYATFGAYLIDQGWSAQSGFAAGPGSPAEHVSAATPRLPLADRAAHEWRYTPSIRTEFSDSFDRYLSFRRASEDGSVGPLRRRAGVVALTAEEIAALRKE